MSQLKHISKCQLCCLEMLALVCCCLFVFGTPKGETKIGPVEVGCRDPCFTFGEIHLNFKLNMRPRTKTQEHQTSLRLDPWNTALMRRA